MNKRFMEICKLCNDNGVRADRIPTSTRWRGGSDSFRCFAAPEHRAYMEWLRAVVRRYVSGVRSGFHTGKDYAQCHVRRHGPRPSGVRQYGGNAYARYYQTRYWLDFIETLRREGLEEVSTFCNPSSITCRTTSPLRSRACDAGRLRREMVAAISLDHSFADRYRSYMARFLISPSSSWAVPGIPGIGHGGGGFDVRGWRYSLSARFPSPRSRIRKPGRHAG